MIPLDLTGVVGPAAEGHDGQKGRDREGAPQPMATDRGFPSSSRVHRDAVKEANQATPEVEVRAIVMKVSVIHFASKHRATRPAKVMVTAKLTVWPRA